MSIHHFFTRTFDGRTSTCLDREITHIEALRYLIQAEFSFGSDVVYTAPAKICITSSCAGCDDNASFSGSVADMSELVRLSNLYTETKDSMRINNCQRVSTQDATFNACANSFIAQSSKGKTSIQLTLMTLIAMRAPNVNFTKLNGEEIIDLYLQLVSGELDANEVSEVFA